MSGVSGRKREENLEVGGVYIKGTDFFEIIPLFQKDSDTI